MSALTKGNRKAKKLFTEKVSGVKRVRNLLAFESRWIGWSTGVRTPYGLVRCWRGGGSALL